MADLSDVERVLVTTLTQIIFPTGLSGTSIAACRLPYRGWPIPANLDTDLAAGLINVSVFPLDAEQSKTRYGRDWQELPITPATLTVAVTQTTITVAGVVASPLNATALVNGKSYVYPVQPTDTLTSIATALAALINPDTPATNSGPVITVAGAKQLNARIGTFGTLIRETKRQKRSFQITFWCPTPALRDSIVPPCDQALCALTFLSLPDGSAGRIVYERSHVADQKGKANLFRRDLFYSVEYATTETKSAPQIVTELINLNGGLDPNSPLIKTFSF